ncbi:hypothetical protein HY639_02720 [Candidatus Woesearchaeota archaeon]|nr:hypothetical protein [Candidatus Woesearchaeota archaeon]
MSPNPVVDIALSTIGLNKQALVFVHSKASAEKSAEEIAHALKRTTRPMPQLAAESLTALDKPTKQCERLAACLTYGVAFHHAGLPSVQRSLIEDGFRQGTIKIIACTPTLAAGINLPSFRAVIKDLKRYTMTGMDWIPTLEYQQMAGRCGRPDFNDTHGEVIAIASDERMRDEIYKRYLNGLPEEIFSKLAVEPVLRTYALSLIATRSFHTREQLHAFFEKTFWAHQYRDLQRLRMQLDKMVNLLTQWGFIDAEAAAGFMSALTMDNYTATPLGKRVAELYLDPLTAYDLVQGIRSAQTKKVTPFTLLHLISCTLEMRPLLHVGTRDYDKIQEQLVRHDDELVHEADFDQDSFLDGTKTALCLHDWIEEADEEHLYEKYNIRPGEIHVKLERADWLLFALSELASIMGHQPLRKEIASARTRLTYGVKEELLPLIRFEGIGKMRARILYTHGIRDVAGVKKAPYSMLSTLVGKQVAASLKQQVGMPVEQPKHETPSTLLAWSAKKPIEE